MSKKNNEQSQTSEAIADFGEEFGLLTKQSISDVFVDIHASISPLDPLFVKAIDDGGSVNQN